MEHVRTVLLEAFARARNRLIARFAAFLEHARTGSDRRQLAALLMTKAILFNCEGEPHRAYEVLQETRSLVEADDRAAGECLYTLIFGGAVNGDKYQNILFHNPGQGNRWLTVKLLGPKTNRAAIGARIKLVTAGKDPLTVHRHVSSGSSFGANALEQTIGLGKADRVAVLEVRWPSSKTTQVFRDIAPDQGIEITESAESYRRLNWNRLPQPE
jgi:hypothetical protein